MIVKYLVQPKEWTQIDSPLAPWIPIYSNGCLGQPHGYAWLRTPQFSGGSPISSHVQLAGEAIHAAASGGHLEILKDLLATWWHRKKCATKTQKVMEVCDVPTEKRGKVLKHGVSFSRFWWINEVSRWSEDSEIHTCDIQCRQWAHEFMFN